jgi:hypothetical protein
MQTRDAIPSEATAAPESLEQQVHVLRERLAFYEGFDRLIQENVAHARELFRLAAQERAAASAEVDTVRRDAGQRETALRAQVESIALEVDGLAEAVGALSDRVARALEDFGESNGRVESPDSGGALAVAVVAHGVASAGDALSLQRFVASLPQVAGVTAREFAGGMLRLEARVHDELQIDQLRTWEPLRMIEPLTERSDVIEFALGGDSR